MARLCIFIGDSISASVSYLVSLLARLWIRKICERCTSGTPRFNPLYIYTYTVQSLRTGVTKFTWHVVFYVSALSWPRVSGSRFIPENQCRKIIIVAWARSLPDAVAITRHNLTKGQLCNWRLFIADLTVLWVVEILSDASNIAIHVYILGHFKVKRWLWCVYFYTSWTLNMK